MNILMMIPFIKGIIAETKADFDNYGVVKLSRTRDTEGSGQSYYHGALAFDKDGNLMVVTQEHSGIVKGDFSGELCILRASNDEIDAKTHQCKPIVPANLEYAVKSCTDSIVTETGEMPVSGSAVNTLVSNIFSLDGDTLDIYSPEYAEENAIMTASSSAEVDEVDNYGEI